MIERSATVLLLALSLGAAAPASDLTPEIRRALAAAGRQQDPANDARRHPAKLLAFTGVRTGEKAAELIPGSGYFTRLFSRMVGPRGRVYVVCPYEYAKVAGPDPENSKALSKSPGYHNISVLEQPAAAFSAPEPLDLVFTSQDFHDYPDPLMGKVDPVAFSRQVFAALRPGGRFVIVDHAAEPGSGLRDTDTLHRIDPAVVRRQVESVGFVFEGASEALRNPADDHRRKVFDPAVRGRTDQFAFKFRKSNWTH